MKDFKYIIKRVIIGLCIGIGVLLFKNNFAFADTTPMAARGTTTFYAQTQNCDLDNSNNLVCSKGTPIKAIYNTNKTGQPDIDLPFLIPNEHNILVSNLVMDIDLDRTYTIDNNQFRSVFVNIDMSFFLRNTPSQGYRYYSPGFLPFNTYINDTMNSNYSIPSMYGFKPFYCSYYDTISQETKTCNVKYDYASSYTGFKIVPQIPLDTSFNRITLYFGTTNLYSGSTKELCNLRVPNSDTFINNNCNSNNYYDKYPVLYTNWRASSYTPVGIWYYPIGSIINTPQFKVPNLQSFLMYANDTFASNTYGADFSNLTTEQINSYRGLIAQIEQDLNSSYEVGDTWFQDSMDGFVHGTTSNNLISLFNSLLAYPLHKISTNAQIDLVKTNLNGDKVLNDTICMKNSTSGVLGEYNAYEVQFYRDYKFKMPCPHTEIYTHLKYGDYAFYGTTFLGADLGNSVGGQFNFVSIWLTIQHGVLVYLLFVNCLNVLKYVLDSNKTEIEVLEL